jgi:hypothetical protein
MFSAIAAAAITFTADRMISTSTRAGAATTVTSPLVSFRASIPCQSAFAACALLAGWSCSPKVLELTLGRSREVVLCGTPPLQPCSTMQTVAKASIKPTKRHIPATFSLVRCYPA